MHLLDTDLNLLILRAYIIKVNFNIILSAPSLSSSYNASLPIWCTHHTYLSYLRGQPIVIILTCLWYLRRGNPAPQTVKCDKILDMNNFKIIRRIIDSQAGNLWFSSLIFMLQMLTVCLCQSVRTVLRWASGDRLQRIAIFLMWYSLLVGYKGVGKYCLTDLKITTY
jgi:hypothetical protein